MAEAAVSAAVSRAAEVEEASERDRAGRKATAIDPGRSGSVVCSVQAAEREGR